MAVRLAQLLGLHKLGNHHLTMPIDDPAWSRSSCSLRRELAKRLWAFVVILDWYYCAPKGVAMINDGNCKSTWNGIERYALGNLRVFGVYTVDTSWPLNVSFRSSCQGPPHRDLIDVVYSGK
jgi:hypothetical protein